MLNNSKLNEVLLVCMEVKKDVHTLLNAQKDLEIKNEQIHDAIYKNPDSIMSQLHTHSDRINKLEGRYEDRSKFTNIVISTMLTLITTGILAKLTDGFNFQVPTQDNIGITHEYRKDKK